MAKVATLLIAFALATAVYEAKLKPKVRVSRGKLLYGSDWGYGYGNGFGYGFGYGNGYGSGSGYDERPTFEVLNEGKSK